MNTTTAIAPEIETFGREHFKAGAYYLELGQLANNPLIMNGQPSTFMEVLRLLLGAKVKDLPTGLGFGRDEYITEKGILVVSEPKQGGHSWSLQILKKLMELAQTGADIQEATWYYYANDWSRDADEMHIFFVTYQNKIVLEHMGFTQSVPLILKKAEPDEEPVWHSQPHFDEAVEVYWYRKFYNEAFTGQLMVLRPDQPILYHYERPRARDVMRDVEFVTLSKTYRLLWVAVPFLAAIAFPAISVYMAIVAIALTIDLLWRCWVTRKIGKIEE
jgi:hypothetical protein